MDGSIDRKRRRHRPRPWAIDATANTQTAPVLEDRVRVRQVALQRPRQVPPRRAAGMLGCGLCRLVVGAGGQGGGGPPQGAVERGFLCFVEGRGRWLSSALEAHTNTHTHTTLARSPTHPQHQLGARQPVPPDHGEDGGRQRRRLASTLPLPPSAYPTGGGSCGVVVGLLRRLVVVRGIQVPERGGRRPLEEAGQAVLFGGCVCRECGGGRRRGLVKEYK